MFHIPIMNANNIDYQIEFSHINSYAPAGNWRKETKICLNNVKINIFLQGEFSVIIDEKCYHPTYGDICVLPPFKMHCGQITKPTHTDYYQLDVGIKVFDAITNGNDLMKRLISNRKDNGIFFRPQKKDADHLLLLCGKIEKAIINNNEPMAFSHIIELLDKISNIHTQSNKCTTFNLSKLTIDTLNYIENNYSHQVVISDIAKQFSVSNSYLSRLFKKEVGVGIHEYLTKHRIYQASYLLQNNSVTDVCYLCGFNDCSHFIAVFRKHFGCTPSSYKKSIYGVV